MALKIARLLTEYAVNPLGIDAVKPRLSWTLSADGKGKRQTAYQVLVASSPDLLARDEGDMWDSGKVESEESIHIRYSGTPLASGAFYYWKVRVWDEQGEVSPWSEPAHWSMGMLKTSDWRGKWIGMWQPHTEDYRQPAYLRKVFTIAKPVKRAVLYATALGLYELYLAGNKVGDHEFAPGWTDYNVRVQYQTYDVTDRLTKGPNVFGAILASGWYCGKLAMVGKRKYGYCPYLLAQMKVEYEDGTEEWIKTDETWKASTGPMLYSEIYRGETYDARLELRGWLEPDYDDSNWEKPIELPYIGDQYGGKLVAQVDPPARVTRKLKPVAMWKTDWGTYIFDMGQNMVGRVQVKVQAEAGTRIGLHHAETLDVDGTLYKKNLRTAVQEDYYICKGEGVEVYEPTFTFHGFRYVELEGYPGEPDLDTITGHVIHTDAPFTGKLETAHPLVNQLQSNIVWGQMGNFISVPTDCPQRDERLGWTGDAQVFCRTAAFNMEVARFFGKYTLDMVDAQTESGTFPMVAPNCGYHIRKIKKRIGTEWHESYVAGWADAGVIIPWTLYLVYGDKDLLERIYPSLVTYMGFLKSMSRDGLIPEDRSQHFGDWLSVNADTPRSLISNAYYAYSTELMANIAEVLGKEEDALKYRIRANQIKAAFTAQYAQPDGKLAGDTQTGYALALCFDLLPEPLAKRAAEQLVANIRQHGNHLTVGFLGVEYLLPALSRYGYSSVAYDLLLQETYPSWLYQIHNGATTMWERWDGYSKEKGFHPHYKMNSFNHYAYGAVGEWMYRYMAGIEAVAEKPGYRHFRIQPEPDERIPFVRGEYESLYGKIVSSWKLEEGRFTLQVTIPVNTTATILLPVGEVLVDETDLANGWLKPLGTIDGKTAYEAGSGDYTFTVLL